MNENGIRATDPGRTLERTSRCTSGRRRSGRRPTGWRANGLRARRFLHAGCLALAVGCADEPPSESSGEAPGGTASDLSIRVSTLPSGDDVGSDLDPRDEREVPSDETVELVVVAHDAGGPAPTVAALDSPPDSEFLARADGSHLFRWHPSRSDAGALTVVFEATRAGRPDVRARTGVRLDVVAAPRVSRFGEGPPLRDLAEVHGLHLGFAAHREMFDFEEAPLYAAIATEEYDILTPENAMKMTDLRPAPGRFDWAASDRIVDFAEAHDMLVHGHPLVWGGQQSRWIRELDAAAFPALMREHVTALVSRYRGRVHVWDVVNEAFLRDGSFRQSRWYLNVGERFFADAFRLARELDPEASLIYNDYDIGWLNPKSDALHERLRGELDLDTPIDGVGFQLHLDTVFEPGVDSLRENFRRFAELGLDIYITEMDVAVDTREDQALEAERQADVYADVLLVCLEQPRCRAMQTWGLGDRHAWRESQKVMPFDADYRAKPAYHAMRRVLQQTPTTPRASDQRRSPARFPRPLSPRRTRRSRRSRAPGRQPGRNRRRSAARPHDRARPG